MGNSQQPTYEARFNSKYSFNQMVDDPNFGLIKVYRKKELNFDYVMILQKYVNSHELPTLTSQISQIHSSFLTETQPMTLRIFNYEVIKDKVSQCKLPLIRLYIEYFNYTLHDLIRKNAEKNQTFSAQEIVYILSSIIQTYQFFNKINPSYFSINLQSIYLTPEGCLKFSPVKVRDFFQEPDAFCNALIYQKREKEIINYERSKKAMLSQIKKLVHLLIHAEAKPNLKQIRKAVDKAQSLEELKGKIGRPTIQCLLLSKGNGQTTQSLFSQHESKPSSQTRTKKSIKQFSGQKSS